MKALLFATLLHLATFAQAEMVGRALNGDGKYIELHNVACGTSRGMPKAITTNIMGQSIEGCWRIDNDTVTIRWNDGDLIRYPVDAFDVFEPAPTPMPNKEPTEKPKTSNYSRMTA
jgi:hypothetical protein